MFKRFSLLSLFVVSLLVASTSAFCPPKTTNTLNTRTTFDAAPHTTTTQLAERQWNFNEGRSPWGLKKNAEIWNGRLAQVNHNIID